MVDYGRGNAGIRYVVLMPNSSLPFGQAIVLFAGMFMLSLSVALVFCLKGFWLILPFSGVELLVLGYCLVITMKKCGVKEVITISDKVIRVERGLKTAESKSELPLAWLRVELDKPKYKGYPQSLMLSSHGKRIEVGRFLVESEREKLAIQLKKMLVMPT